MQLTHSPQYLDPKFWCFEPNSTDFDKSVVSESNITDFGQTQEILNGLFAHMIMDYLGREGWTIDPNNFEILIGHLTKIPPDEISGGVVQNCILHILHTDGLKTERVLGRLLILPNLVGLKYFLIGHPTIIPPDKISGGVVQNCVLHILHTDGLKTERVVGSIVTGCLLILQKLVGLKYVPISIKFILSGFKICSYFNQIYIEWVENMFLFQSN